MRRRPSDPDAFGVSLLDMLACGLGAIALLFILGEVGLLGEIEAAKQRRNEAQAMLDGARGALDPAKVERMIVNAIEDGARGDFLREGAAEDLAPLGGARNILIFLDVSGSMSRYANASDPIADPRLRARLTAEGSKWGDAISLLALGVLAGPDIERFAVLPITSGLRGDVRLGEPLVRAADGAAWHPKIAVLDVQDELAAVAPGGGAAHGPSFAAAEEFVQEADAILIITDGLPNAGPVQGCENNRFISAPRPDETACFLDGVLNAEACPNFCLSMPTEGEIGPESKVRRAGAAVGVLSEMLINRRPLPRVDILLMHWRQDLELVTFAFDLASIGTAGRVVSPGLPHWMDDRQAREGASP